MMPKTMSFEEAMERLEDTVRKLESGTLPLDDAISAYEEAVKLVKICNEKLDCAEQKVRILTESEDGTVTDKDFSGGNED